MGRGYPDAPRVVVFEATSDERADGATRDSRRTQTILGGGAVPAPHHSAGSTSASSTGMAKMPRRQFARMERSPFCENWAWGRDAPPPRRLTPTQPRQQPAPRLAPGGAPPIFPWPRRPLESTSKPGQPITKNEYWTEKLRKTSRAAGGQADDAPVRRLVARASAPANTRQPEQLGYLRDSRRRYTIGAGHRISPARQSLRTIGLLVAGRSSHRASVTRVA